MKIEKNMMVSLIYELRENDQDGRILEALTESRPLTFIFGTGRLLPAFESNIQSLEKGNRFSFGLDAGNAYGEKSEDMIINLPRSAFEKDGKIDEEVCSVGNEVPMVDSEGHQLTGVICEIADSYIKMDFNHPMAGVNLYFSGIVTEVRTATEDELSGVSGSCSSCSGSNESGCGGSCGSN